MATKLVSSAPAAHGETHSERGLVDRLRSRSPWWLLPATVVTVLVAFSIYVLVVAIHWNTEPSHAQYWSPFFSPAPVVSFFQGRSFVPGAFFVLWSPLLFRATCYYYRKSYYRSFFWDPPACAVGELRHRKYKGETRLPLILNNLHRFFLYVAVVVVGFLWYDAIKAFFVDGTTHLYVGVGSLLMLLNVVLLSGYTFSCHSFRHLVGGGMDCFSCARLGNARHATYRFVSVINGNHPTWAWVSMFSVVAVDIYIRLLNANVLSDLHLGG